MVETEQGLASGADVKGWIEQLCAQRGGSWSIDFESLEPLIDSSCATPLQWQRIVDLLKASRNQADAFVVLHGTDTLAYTAAALSYALVGFGKPLVITGSQLPIGFERSDAPRNASDALLAAEKAVIADPDAVIVAFGGRLFQGNTITKVSSTDFCAFDGKDWDASSPSRPREIAFDEPKPYRRFDIAAIDVVPGMSENRFARLLALPPHALILRAYGSGNFSIDDRNLCESLSELSRLGVPIVIGTQCAIGGVSVGRYAASSLFKEIGAISARDMTFDACYAKAVFLLSQDLSSEEFSFAMEHSIAGELTATNQFE